ncbi:MAG: phage integrase N-terminal SAM-like domain-containing protein [Acidobacteria bacterium]|nr:phage integrase N-terminal SAM-like domain-containing protein [Acidobacteriota bacterium]
MNASAAFSMRYAAGGRNVGGGRRQSVETGTSQDPVAKSGQGPPPPDRKPKLLDRLREALRARYYSRRTGQTYCHWVKRFIYFHNVRHPAEMGEGEINAFLTHLAVKERVSASRRRR